MILYVDVSSRTLTDRPGGPTLAVSDRVSFYEGTREKLDIVLYDGQEPFALSESDTFQINLDSDFKHTTPLMARSTTVTVIDAPGGRITSTISFCSSEFGVKLNGKDKINAWLEIWLFRDGSTTPIVLCQDVVIARALVGDPAATVPPDVTSDFYTKAQIDALLRAGIEVQYSTDGQTWTASADEAVYLQFRNGALGGAWSETIRVRGTDGQAATIEVGTVTAVDADNAAAVRNSGTNAAAVLDFDLPRGANGKDGTDGQAATIEVGTVTAVDADKAAVRNSGTSATAVLDFDLPRGANGKDGADMDWDVVGDLAELSIYDEEPAGFRFAATVIDATEQSTTIYVYKKASDATADWLEPLVIKKWSEKGKNADLIPPVEFKKPNKGEKTFVFDISKNSAATVAAVCIDTKDGEYRLPYASARGVLTIYTDRSGGKVRITFGDNVPAYDTGRVYFAQGLATLDQSSPGGDWDSAMWYGYITAEVAGSITSVTQITAEMLAAAKAAGTVTQAETASAIGKVTLANVPAYSWVAALLPSGLKAVKDDGLGGKVAFSLNNGASGSGANGTELTLGDTKLNVYGELQIVTAQTTIYIEEA